MNDLFFSTGMIILVNILAWITPGPNMFAVIATSPEYGRRQGLATGLGLACGTFFWATFSVLGATILFDLFPTAVLALKLIGASYLIWLGFKSVKSSMKQNSIMNLEVMTRASDGKSIVRGFLISITNPKAALFLGSVMTALIPNAAPDWYLEPDPKLS